MTQGNRDHVLFPPSGTKESHTEPDLLSGESQRDWEADLARREAMLQAMAEEQARREAERMRARMKGPGMSRTARGLVALSLGGLAVIGGLVFFVIHHQSLDEERRARAAAARQRAMEEEFSLIRASQEELRKLNRERDALLAQLTEGMAADKAAVRKRLAAIDAKRRALAEKLAHRQHQGHRQGHRGRQNPTTKTPPTKGPKTMGPIDRRYDVLPD